jgi:hypothetical protein
MRVFEGVPLDTAGPHLASQFLKSGMGLISGSHQIACGSAA